MRSAERKRGSPKSLTSATSCTAQMETVSIPFAPPRTRRFSTTLRPLPNYNAPPIPRPASSTPFTSMLCAASWRRRPLSLGTRTFPSASKLLTTRRTERSTTAPSTFSATANTPSMSRPKWAMTTRTFFVAFSATSSLNSNSPCRTLWRHRQSQRHQHRRTRTRSNHMTDTRPKTTGQNPLEHRRPTARRDERGRFPRLHAVVPLPALPLGQLRNGGARRNWARIIPTLGAGRPPRAAGRLVCRTTRTMSPSLKSRCAARCITSSSRSTSGTASPNMARTQNGELLNTLQAGFKYIEERILREHLSRPVLRDQSRLGQSWAGPMPTATPSSAPSSRRSPKGWPNSPPTSTRWAMPTNT